MSRKSRPPKANYISQLTHKNNHPKLKYVNGAQILHLLPLLASSRFIHATRLTTRILSGFPRVVRPINWSPGKKQNYFRSNTDRTTRVSGPQMDYSNKVYFNEWVMPEAAHLLRSWVQIPPEAWIFVRCECRVLSGGGLCDELITRPEESYRLRCVVCDLETSRIVAPYI